MRRLLLQFFALFILIAIVNNLIFSLFNLPFCWGNDVAYLKNQYLLRHGGEYNTLFIGASKTLNQVDVSLFDSLTNHQTQSFNFGVQAVEAGEIYYFADNLIKLHKNIKYAFIEVSDIDFINDANLHTCREKYSSNFQSYWFNAHSILYTNFGMRNKLQGLTYCTITFFEWLFKFDMLKDAKGFKSRACAERNINSVESGFLPLYNDITDLPLISENRREFLNDTSICSKYAAVADRIFSNYGSMKLNTPYYNKLKQVVENLQQKKIQVFLIVAPRTNEVHLGNIVPAFMKISGCAKINLADPKLNPEFYEVKYSHDVGHVNYYGARIYTAKIAKAFNEQVNISGLSNN